MHAAIQQHLHQIIQQLSDKYVNVLLFFKGFSPELYRYLHEQPIHTLHTKDYLQQNGYVNVATLNEQKANMMMSFLMLATTNHTNITWGYYEELILLQDILRQYKGKIFVIDNNLFEKYYFLHLDVEEKLEHYFNSEDMIVDPSINDAIEYYSDIVVFPKEQLRAYSYVNTVELKELSIEEIPFYMSCIVTMQSIDSQEESIYVNDGYFEIVKYQFQQEQSLRSLKIIIEHKQDEEKIRPFIHLANLLSIPVYVQLQSQFQRFVDADVNQYLPLLKRYWGDEAHFRELQFYEDPALHNRTITLSQGVLVNDIIEQSKKAITIQDDYGDIFITSPTGAGKSLLFQLPAIHLAENYQAVTIVITPLIALMRDQVEKLQQERYVMYATYINSDISFQEREQRMKDIHEGVYSIIYISPEFFINNQLSSIIGEQRQLGLLVIDEAHLVTTWGREFRADYWYLGSHVEKMRKTDNLKFPILCLTATATYLGKEDIVNETISSLHLRNHKLYLGNVRRDDITFDIEYIPQQSIKGSIDEFKLEKTVSRIQQFNKKNQKSIVYCPYTTQVVDIHQKLDENHQKRTGMYYGRLDKAVKEQSYLAFKEGTQNTMISTKAFGMGIDIDDIEIVYHYAPTGYLTDYIQEIGRAARRKGIQGVALTDFTDKDMKYVRMLHGLSNIKQYQLQEMIRKLYQVYKEKKNRNFLVSADAFSYLFREDDIENKVKNGLMLIAKDFEEKSKFPVITVRPKSMFTKNFVCVPYAIEQEFLGTYGQYANKITKYTTRLIHSHSIKNSDVQIYPLGEIYELDMANMWENYFQTLTFPQFKSQFFKGELIQFSTGDKVTARAQLRIYFEYSFAKVQGLLKQYLQKISSIFSTFKSRGEYFTRNDFKKMFHEKVQIDSRNNDIANIILDMFVADIQQNVSFNYNVDRLKFIQARKSQSSAEQEFRIMNTNYAQILPHFTRELANCEQNYHDNMYEAFISYGRDNKPDKTFSLAVLLEVLNLASYELIGGKNIEIFVRVNDPSKLRKAIEQPYRNIVLSEIEARRRHAESVFGQFLRTSLSNEERWDVIEDYFLGRDEQIEQRFMVEKELQAGINEAASGVE